MLRWSAELYEYSLDVGGIADPAVPTGIPGARSLIGLVDAFLMGDGSNQEQARHDIVAELGPEGLVDAAAVCGNFEMMNRVAESTGITIPHQAVEREAAMMKALGLYDILKSHHR